MHGRQIDFVDRLTGVDLLPGLYQQGERPALELHRIDADVHQRFNAVLHRDAHGMPRIGNGRDGAADRCHDQPIARRYGETVAEHLCGEYVVGHFLQRFRGAVGRRAECDSRRQMFLLRRCRAGIVGGRLDKGPLIGIRDGGVGLLVEQRGEESCHCMSFRGLCSAGAQR